MLFCLQNTVAKALLGNKRIRMTGARVVASKGPADRRRVGDGLLGKGRVATHGGHRSPTLEPKVVVGSSTASEARE